MPFSLSLFYNSFIAFFSDILELFIVGRVLFYTKIVCFGYSLVDFFGFTSEGAWFVTHTKRVANAVLSLNPNRAAKMSRKAREINGNTSERDNAWSP